MGFHSRGGAERTADATERVQELAKEGPGLSALGARTGTSGRPATLPPPKLYLGALSEWARLREKNLIEKQF